MSLMTVSKINAIVSGQTAWSTAVTQHTHSLTDAQTHRVTVRVPLFIIQTAGLVEDKGSSRSQLSRGITDIY